MRFISIAPPKGGLPIESAWLGSGWVQVYISISSPLSEFPIFATLFPLPFLV